MLLTESKWVKAHSSSKKLQLLELLRLYGKNTSMNQTQSNHKPQQ